MSPISSGGRVRIDPSGLVVRRLFPADGLAQVGPFLLFEHIGPMATRSGTAARAQPEPLQAMECVTGVLEGELEIAHSAGHRAVLGPGDVQWATIGRQVTHSDVPGRRLREGGGALSAFRTWVRLPAALEAVEPRYQEISTSSIPETPWADGGASVWVIAGAALGVRGPVESAVPLTMQLWSLQPAADVQVALPAGWQGFVYGLQGTVKIGNDEPLSEGRMSVLGSEVPVRFRGTDSRARLLLLAGEAMAARPVAPIRPGA